MQNQNFLSGRRAELLMQVGIFLILLFIKAFNKDSDPHLHFFEIIPTALEFGVALGINYWIIPRYFYTQKYLLFLLSILGFLVLGVLIKEVLLDGWSEIKINGSFIWELGHQVSHFFANVILFVGFKLAWDALQNQAELEQLKSMVMESELQFLKSQINPHFLFNNLNNLYAHSLVNAPNTPKIILALSSLMRYMLYDSSEKFVSLEKEFKYLGDFVQLQQLQVESKAHVDLKFQGEVANKFIAPLILVTFVENSFKHSMSSQTKEIDISIHVKIEGDILYFYCANTYTINSNLDQLSKGIGLKNVQNRLRMLYPDAHLLKIEHNGALYEVHLEMNLSIVKSIKG